MNYLTLLEIAALVAELLDIEAVTAGTINATLPESIGVYQRDDFVPRECIGTVSSYETAKIRLLVHWSNNPTTAESKAYEIAEAVKGLRERDTSDHTIKFADVKAVRTIGKDEKGICEYVVDADITYSERNDN